MPIRHILLAALTAMIWGCNFISAKFGMQHFPPFLLSALRFAVVGVVLVPFVPLPAREKWSAIFWISLVLGTGHLAFAVTGMYYGLDVATSVITIQLGTPFACALGAILLNDKLGAWRTGGLVVAFLGIIVVVGTPNVSSNYHAFLMVLFAALMFGVATILMKRLEGVPTMTMVGWMSLLSAPQILLLSFVFEVNQWHLLQTTPITAVASIGYSAFCSSIIGYSWFWLLRRYDVSQVAPFALLVPIFGIICAQIFFHEPLPLQTILGGVITIVGVGVIILRRPKTAELG
jgi:O-acetylserine/cysteine efflux transporter